ncbi:MAG: dihydrofolate reductase [Kiritimatiellia bacterium]
MTPRVTLVVAVADNGVIGRAGDLPWRLPDDLKRFKQTTLGKPVLMGRKTWDSIGRPLPGRRNIIMSTRPGFAAAGADVFPALDAALAACAGEPEVMVIGGAEIYRAALPLATRIHLTRVHAAPEGDTVLDLPLDGWRELSREVHPADDRHAHAFSFITLERP